MVHDSGGHLHAYVAIARGDGSLHGIGRVFASVYSGGGIFTNARQALTAKITSGGSITYWGDARVQKTVRDGGAVRRGKDADADRPLSELGPLAPPPVAPLAPVPPVPPIN